MPVESVTAMLSRALVGRYAVGYFESWNLESLQGVIDAAEETRSPVLIGFNGQFLSRAGRLAAERISWYAALARTAAESASVPCGLVFNECPQDDWVRAAVTSGFGQVMLDDPDADHKDYVRRVVELIGFAHQRGVAVEAEAGELPRGSSGNAAPDGGFLTDPEEAARLVTETGVDILAVSIGNVHVLLQGEQRLDLDLLSAIRERVDLPLDLHGGSGIPSGDLRAAISLGVAKVSYGTYIKQRYLTAVRTALGNDERNPHDLLGYGGQKDVMVAGRFAVRDAILERIERLGCCGRA
jgi:ketose-bisphosphate aldolase